MWGHAFYKNWDQTQKTLYKLDFNMSTAISLALGVIFTQYGVSEWIWSGAIKRPHTQPPTLLASLMMFCVIFTLLYHELSTAGNKQWYHNFTPVFVFGGWLWNLVVTLLWDRGLNPKTDSQEKTQVMSAPKNIHPDKDIETPVVSALKSSTQPGTPAKREILHYINNIKIMLTNVVIVYHCAGWIDPLLPRLYNDMTHNPNNWHSISLFLFTDVCASYFMNLFFFYSGYFVPRSFDKKGCYEFLLDRFKRLGIPMVVYTFFLGPYVQIGLDHLSFGYPFPFGKTFFYGPTWFINQLMIFSVCYALLCGKDWNPKMACPSLIGFFLFSLAIGLCSGIMVLFGPSTDRFFAVPRFWSNYLNYPVFFFGGGVAQRNGWMASIHQKSRVVIYLWAAVSIGLFAALFHDEKKVKSKMEYLFVRGILWKGVMNVGISLAVSVFFFDHCNRKYKYLTPFFSKAMYTAYIIQHLTQVLAMKHVFSSFEAAGYIQGKYFTDDSMILPAFFAVSVATLVLCWPLAYLIRSIPGFSQVL